LALLLHLSDLHLAQASSEDVIADNKWDVLELGDQQTRLGVIRNSLRALGQALTEANKELDSIVITGDVTVKGSPAGFALLDEVLDCLGAALPPRDRILVLPGNHDVVRDSKASSPERYEGFLELRKRGYRTAHIDGIDLGATGKVLSSASGVLEPLLCAVDNSFVLVGLNSANHSASGTNIEKKVRRHLVELRKAASTGNKAVAALLEAWEDRGRADIARLDQAQLIEGSRLLQAAPAASASTPLRMVALHHQVLPVAVNEEIKPFEQLSNLAEFRDWLVDNKLDVVLHGHKHEGRVMSDRHTAHHDPTHEAHDMLLVSAPTIQVGSNRRDPVGYLFDIQGPAPRYSGILIADVPAMEAGGLHAFADLSWTRQPIDTRARNGILEGETVDDVYRQLIALRDQLAEIQTPLVCRVLNGGSANSLPIDYPALPPTAGSRTDWFATTVGWWQQRRDLKAAPFTHGQRLFRGTAEEINQIEHAVTALKGDRDSSRAVAVLLDPRRDFAEARRDFPAFVLVQFVVHGDDLDVIAFFRKQEMPHWWPINVGELAELQREVLTRVKKKWSALRSGSITTITSMPVNGTAIPRVAVPVIDQKAEDPDGVLNLVVPLFVHGLDTGSAEVETQWRAVFDDWRPTADAPADGDRAPRLGLDELAQQVTLVQKLSGRVEEPAGHLAAELLGLSRANQTFVTYTDEQADVERPQWVSDVERSSRRILELVHEMLVRRDTD
jgi:3',5'-cyclic AMP phosphodiesterase CpdA